MTLLHSKEYGAGSTVIILHGLFGSLENWHHIATRLSSRFRIFSLDLRNHGRSLHSDEMDYPAMAEDVLHFMQAHGLEKPSLLGHSMGGKTAMQFALSYPGALKSLVVADIAPKAYAPSHLDILGALQSLRIDRYQNRWEMDAALAPAIPDPAVRQFLLKSVARDANGRFSWRLNLRALSENYPLLTGAIPAKGPCAIPALFVAGDSSDYLRAEDEPAIRALFPNAKFATIPKAGHWLHAEAPEPFLKVVSEFLVRNELSQQS